VRGYATVVNEEELLDRQEEAIRNAKEALEAQLAQIEERRQELQRGEE
jgi:hypothetical protein